MKALLICPEAPDPPHGGGPMRSACVLEWLERRYDVYALVFHEPGTRNPELGTRALKVVKLPRHSAHPVARAWRNLKRAARGIPPLVDRFFCPQARQPLKSLLEEGPFDLALFEHFWSAPWIELVRPHCRMAILDLHNREPEFCRALGGPLAGWFERSAERWEARLLPRFDQVWDTGLVPTGLPLRPRPGQKGRVFDVAFSGTLAYPPNREALEFFFARIWPRIVARRPGTSAVIIGKNPEAVPRRASRDPRVLVTGPVEDAMDWLGRARVAVAPLRRGAGMSVKIAEAWAAGCAVVATPVGARGYISSEFRVPGSEFQTGLVLADSPEEFAGAVVDLLEDEARREELAGAGRRRFENEYCWPVIHARLDLLVPSSAFPVPSWRTRNPEPGTRNCFYENSD